LKLFLVYRMAYLDYIIYIFSISISNFTEEKPFDYFFVFVKVIMEYVKNNLLKNNKVIFLKVPFKLLIK